MHHLPAELSVLIFDKHVADKRRTDTHQLLQLLDGHVRVNVRGATVSAAFQVKRIQLLFFVAQTGRVLHEDHVQVHKGIRLNCEYTVDAR